MEILVYFLNFVGLCSFVAASLVKGKRMRLILFLSCLGNVVIAVAYQISGNGINGAISGYLGGVLAVINYLFESKSKPIPKWLMGVYAASFTVLNLWLGWGSWRCVLAVVACLCFVMGLVQPTGKQYRAWTIGNCTTWCVYDAVSRAWGALVTHAVIFVFTVTGILIHDLKRKKAEV
jgi:hypothetical protein